MGVRAIGAQKIIWALQQGPETDTPKHLKALRKKIKKQRKKTVGPGAMQLISDPTKVTDKSKLLYSIFFPVK